MSIPQNHVEPPEDASKKIAKAVTSLLEALGEDPSREGLLKTPDRVAKSFLYLTGGYKKDLKS